jgi:hypothetical protein
MLSVTLKSIMLNVITLRQNKQSSLFVMSVIGKKKKL